MVQCDIFLAYNKVMEMIKCKSYCEVTKGTPYTSPWMASYVVKILDILEKIYHAMGDHCVPHAPLVPWIIFVAKLSAALILVLVFHEE